MKLYYAPYACSQSPHIVLRELGLPFQLERVDLATHRTARGADYRAINPKGYVPALELDDGSVLTEGPAIVQYLADQKPGSGLVPKWGTKERYEVQAWLNFVSSELHKPLGAFFGPPMSEAQQQAQREKIARQLDYVEGELGKRMWLVDTTYTVADIYLFVITSWSEGVGLDPGRWPNLLAWRRRIAERPAVKEVLAVENALEPVPA